MSYFENDGSRESRRSLLLSLDEGSHRVEPKQREYAPKKLCRAGSRPSFRKPSSRGAGRSIQPQVVTSPQAGAIRGARTAIPRECNSANINMGRKAITHRFLTCLGTAHSLNSTHPTRVERTPKRHSATPAIARPEALRGDSPLRLMTTTLPGTQYLVSAAPINQERANGRREAAEQRGGQAIRQRESSGSDLGGHQLGEINHHSGVVTPI